MKQIADGGHPRPRQEMLSDADGTKMSSDIRFDPVTVNMNISSVCLPLVSENKKLIWVPSQQIELHPNEAAELDKAFDRFPYLTNEQTAALAQRCSLHPDQVKVWFMAQRLRYGISWDYKDITEVCSKLKSSEGDTEGNEELKSTKGKKEHKQGKKKKQKEKNIRDNEQLKRKTVQEQPLQTEINRTVKEDKVSPEKKQNMIGIDERERKRMRPYNVEVIEGETKPEVKSDNSENEGQKCKLEDTFQKLIQELPAYMNTNVPSVPQVASNPFTEVDNPLLAGDQCTFASQNKNNGSDACCPSCISSNKVKTHAQLSIMKVGFIKCQYPDNDYYRQLALLTGLCRKKLVEWYSDTRYQVKKSKPRWMNEKQHRQALDNIKYRQRLTKLAQL